MKWYFVLIEWNKRNESTVYLIQLAQNGMKEVNEESEITRLFLSLVFRSLHSFFIPHLLLDNGMSRFLCVLFILI